MHDSVESQEDAVQTDQSLVDEGKNSSGVDGPRAGKVNLNAT